MEAQLVAARTLKCLDEAFGFYDGKERMHVMEVGLDQHLADIRSRKLKHSLQPQVVMRLRIHMRRARLWHKEVTASVSEVGFTDAGYQSNTPRVA